MKKMISVMLVLLLCATFVCSVAAAENDFVPSITYKPMPAFAGTEADDGCLIIGYVVRNGERVAEIHYDNGDVYAYCDFLHEGDTKDHECLVITPLAHAETSEEIPDDAESLLLWVYEQLMKLGMKFIDCPELDASIAENLGAGKTVEDMVVRDLFDVSVICEELEEYLEPEDTVICLDFDLGLAPNTFVEVVTYKNDKWQMIEAVEVNEDGSVTCTTYEHFCPVAFLVPEGTADAAGAAGAVAVNADMQAPDTGLNAQDNVVLWSVIAAGALVALAALVIVQRKRTSKG